MGSTPIRTAQSGSISVGLEFVIWDHEVAGSSPVFPTIKPS